MRQSTQRTYRDRRLVFIALTALLLVLPFAPARTQTMVDITTQGILRLGDGMTSENVGIHGVRLGMGWSEARNILDRRNVPYLFQKSTSPVILIPPQQPTYYLVLNASSYEIIEMGIMGSGQLMEDNQFLYDFNRWRLTTARVEFFGTEGEHLLNEEGEVYNFPFQGFVLKYLDSRSFRFVMVKPTNKPNLRGTGGPVGEKQIVEKQIVEERVIVQVPEERVAPSPNPLERCLSDFSHARDEFEAYRYSTALDLFTGISQTCEDRLMQARSTYWIGECYYGMKLYAKARAQFQKVLQYRDYSSLTAPAKKMIRQCNSFLKKGKKKGR